MSQQLQPPRKTGKLNAVLTCCMLPTDQVPTLGCQFQTSPGNGVQVHLVCCS